MDDKLKYTVLSSFADDTRVINGIKSLLNIFELQYDLNMIYNLQLDETKQHAFEWQKV